MKKLAILVLLLGTSFALQAQQNQRGIGRQEWKAWKKLSGDSSDSVGSSQAAVYDQNSKPSDKGDPNMIASARNVIGQLDNKDDYKGVSIDADKVSGNLTLWGPLPSQKSKTKLIYGLLKSPGIVTVHDRTTIPNWN